MEPLVAVVCPVDVDWEVFGLFCSISLGWFSFSALGNARSPWSILDASGGLLFLTIRWLEGKKFD